MGFLGDILEALFGSGIGGTRGIRRPGPPVSRIPGTKLPASYGGEVSFSRGFIGRTLSLKRSRLQYLACHHPRPYRVRRIVKHDGTERALHEPVEPLKFAQRRIMKRLLYKVELHPAAHGFRRGRSIVSNARPHVGKETVIGLDIQDFFPSITFPRVYGMFRSISLEKSEAALMAALTTHEGRLPQGAPSSPAIANIICRRLDRRLAGLAKKAGADYTRYADDITFSGPRSVLSILPAVRKIIREEGFTPHPGKTRIMGRGTRQQVTGLVVNDKVSVPRRDRRKLRAMLHTIGQAGGIDSPGSPEGLRAFLQGHASYVRMVDRELGDRLRAEVAAL